MKTFLEFIQTLPTDRPAGSPPESIPSGMNFSFNFPKGANVSYADITDPRVIDDINNHLEVGLHDSLITPYVALERARKILAPYGIVIQGVAWLNGDDGEQVFSIYQWGGVYGSKGVGNTPTDTVDTDLKINKELSIYFAWSYSSEKNAFDIYCTIVNQEDLVDLLDTDFDGTRYDEQDDMKDALGEDKSGYYGRETSFRGQPYSDIHSHLKDNGYRHSQKSPTEHHYTVKGDRMVVHVHPKTQKVTKAFLEPNTRSK